MKVAIGNFTTESNANIPVINEITDYDIAFGELCIDKMLVREVFDSNNIEIIPTVYANAGASGVIRRETYDYIESCFLKVIKERKDEIDGLYLHFHGASEVEGMGSADHKLLREIREVVGPYVPICIACDPHGNLRKDYVEATQVIRSYRESPHTDSAETKRLVAKMLIDILNDRQQVHSVYRKLPLILGGEQSVSADEPVKTINKYMDELEADARIRSCSWHVGYIRHDTPVAGCGIVVCPQTAADQNYAEEIADRLEKYVWDKRHEFHYTGTTAAPADALKMTLDFPESPCVITDSGDNATSGAMSWNTYVLRQFLDVKTLEKSVLFATINDPCSYTILADKEVGSTYKINLGINLDEMNKSVELEVVIKSKGEMTSPVGFGGDNTLTKVVGNEVFVNVKGTKIDIVISNVRQAIIYDSQLRHIGINWRDYDITVVKQGYIFPMFKEFAKFYVMSLTDGPTPQNTAALNFKHIMRPMFPIDQI
ncbi:MAG: M81 family metallopeptidase [Anaerorhabdus sp.]